ITELMDKKMKTKLNDNMPLYGTNSVYVEQMYERYLDNPANVDASWQGFFRDMGDSVNSVIKGHRGASWAPRRLAVVGVKEQVPAKPAKEAVTGKEDVERACSDSLKALM